MESLEQKYFNKLKDEKMFDETVFVFVAKWNSFIAASYITTCGDDLYITPSVSGNSLTPASYIDRSIKKTKRINKSEISNIVIKRSLWTGSKITIELKNGKDLKYRLVNSSWAANAQELVNWFGKN